MKIAVVVSAILALAVAAPPLAQSKDAQVLRYENDNIGLGGYNFAYDTSDGISRQESAQLNNAGSDQEALAVRGTYSWIADDGQQYTVNYIADENGFRPEGIHLPH